MNEAVIIPTPRGAEIPPAPSEDEILAALKRLTGLDGYTVTHDEGRITAYSFASTPGTYGQFKAALFYHPAYGYELIGGKR